MISRRRFVKGSVTACLLGSAAKGLASESVVSEWVDSEPLTLEVQEIQGAQEAYSPRPPFGILQGPTDATTTVFSVLRKQGQKLTYRVYEALTKNFYSSSVETFLPPPGILDVVDQVKLTQLSPGVEYQLQVIDESFSVVDERTFSTLAPGKNLRFAMCSCMLDTLHRAQIWDQVISQNPDFILFIGDAVYADKWNFLFGRKLSPLEIWRQHVGTRQTLQIYRSPRLIPIFATWDDHDYGQNNSDSTFVYKNESFKIFTTFFPRLSPAQGSLGPGLSSQFKMGDQNFFLMDDRFFRSPPQAFIDQQWGQDQEEWLYESLKSSGTPSWIFNGVQFFGGYLSSDNFERGTPDSFSRFTKQIKALQVPILLGSGDVHFSEVMKIEKDVFGFETFELTSSGMHTFPGRNPPNPRRMATTRASNFLLVDSQILRGGIQFHVQSIGASGSALFQQDGLVEV